MTYQQWRMIKKDLRHRFSTVGWTLLAYYGIMNVAVFFAVFVESVIRIMNRMVSGNLDNMMDVAVEAASSAWGYFLAAAVGILILLIWKKPRYWREEIWAKGAPMKPGSFCAILCIFMAGQSVYQILAIIIELILNAFGLSMVEGLSEMALDTDNFSMFLYAGILAPITEEILFRGLIQRTLQPYGKKFAILCSAFCFGIFHGNLLQSPYAFLVGLVLGYVASEYAIGWAMVLHMINNLVVADILNRLTAGLSDMAATLIIWAVTGAFTVAAIIIAIARRKNIKNYLRSERMNKTCLRCFFSCAGMIVLMIIMGLSMIYSFVMMLSPV